jgi:O-antigen/teichoic acid export membrane protein
MIPDADTEPQGFPSPAGQVQRSLMGARRDALIYFPASAVPAVISALQTAVFTQVYSTASWGVYALALSVVQLAVTIMSAWHERATIRFVSAEEGRREVLGAGDRRPALELAGRLTWWNVAIFIVVALPTLMVVALLYPASLPLAITGVLFGVGSLLSIGLSAIHRALLHSWAVVRSRLVASVAGFAVSLLAVLALGPLPSLLMLGPALGMLLGSVLLLSDLGKGRSQALASAPRDSPVVPLEAAPTTRTFLRFGVPLAGFYIAGWVLNLSDRFLLFGLAGASDVGIYAPNYAIGNLIISLATVPLAAAMSSRILRLTDASPGEEVGRTVGAASRDFLLATVPLLIWVVLAREQISAVLLGPEFRTGSAVIPLVAAGTLTWALGQYIHKPLEMRNRTVTLLLVACVCSLVNVGLNLFLIPPLGYMGAAWSTLIAYSLYPVLAYLLTLSSVRWSVPWGTLGSLAAGGLASLLLGQALLRAWSSAPPVLMGALLAILVGAVTLLVLFGTRQTSPRRLREVAGEVLKR